MELFQGRGEMMDGSIMLCMVLVYYYCICTCVHCVKSICLHVTLPHSLTHYSMLGGVHVHTVYTTHTHVSGQSNLHVRV